MYKNQYDKVVKEFNEKISKYVEKECLIKHKPIEDLKIYTEKPFNLVKSKPFFTSSEGEIFKFDYFKCCDCGRSIARTKSLMDRQSIMKQIINEYAGKKNKPKKYNYQKVLNIYRLENKVFYQKNYKNGDQYYNLKDNDNNMNAVNIKYIKKVLICARCIKNRMLSWNHKFENFRMELRKNVSTKSLIEKAKQYKLPKEVLKYNRFKLIDELILYEKSKVDVI